MKLLITSGGTSEKIDQVRSITNHSTGKLGALIADSFLAQGDQVTLITTRNAIKPAAHPNLTIQIIENVQELFEMMKPLVKTHDVLIHSMAISDYTPIYMTGFEQITTSQDLTEFLNKTNKQSKISSKDNYQVLFLKQTPKIISQVKKWNPNIRLIGFKLLVDVSKEELLTVARASLTKNQAEIIVANDLSDISDNQHHAYLVKINSVIKADTKEEIAQQLVTHIHTKDNL
ncbi:phosphopantothenate--cysteine ligase [Streptococcus intermedius]|uniref:phosphopantothenate--cysteine ligase n=1 Tax=Streptococcus intermedius TaxID=1338 RepID=UPI000F66C88D|nr:phosphopantothenate--cysteine ligase [Streptococcus intermedius]MCI3917712.1 phosphopantothenate--cysteine ligase [Streptococcus intermedius]RSJ20355.1 Coenzyme A biosynthesis bifunctional protein CoaBC [Streptococcus intermedius]RSJ21651.1 Coenzyme A biosynthesis bifunctional protein CoaBC [Streptococcus intermedius]